MTDIDRSAPSNPPAFPNDGGVDSRVGMTLRDWFAGQAATMPMPHYWRGTDSGGLLSTPEAAAKRAYAIADAMLTERQGGAS